MVADNDLALGRIVEAISHSKFWPETAIFVNEDDAQDGDEIASTPAPNLQIPNPQSFEDVLALVAQRRDADRVRQRGRGHAHVRRQIETRLDHDLGAVDQMGVQHGGAFGVL